MTRLVDLICQKHRRNVASRKIKAWLSSVNPSVSDTVTSFLRLELAPRHFRRFHVQFLPFVSLVSVTNESVLFPIFPNIVRGTIQRGISVIRNEIIRGLSPLRGRSGDGCETSTGRWIVKGEWRSIKREREKKVGSLMRKGSCRRYIGL